MIPGHEFTAASIFITLVIDIHEANKKCEVTYTKNCMSSISLSLGFP